ncbi:RNase P/RNase MRP complex subunit [Mactra antiquata]
MELYCTLPKSVKDPSDQHKKKKKGNETINDFLTEFLPNKRIKTGENSLKDKVLMLDSVRQKWEKPLKTKCRNSLSAKDRRRFKVFDIEQGEHRFNDYIPLHKMWQEYMMASLDIKRYNLPNPGPKKENNERLLKADYHGCMITVRKTKCPSLLGQSGIVLMETKNTFKIVTKDNKLKILPKMNSLFSFTIKEFVFTIHGSQFCSKSSMRVRKKFKFKGSADL